ncbi:similar to Saccharomyces cerevisiae YHL016C DUR3 Plasma membrane transporter for both urea and polyamines [Maudiozyma saulgeensis]|uniref:Similar to Saccharomyces cerevisiae YHL016C DUR3 Plasma membrane transporter for both urea and polyamines n=1 Tax=Maudiozyma saulgeensis TaxID=1789683 RepID=A0A1X7R7Y1_9SACH|nr:similar to Saccharomyces cerevisiae YHL016C DUR3 Plasma membrane transporter for both urea and polyamines [Kazachstania saulgeensis]
MGEFKAILPQGAGYAIIVGLGAVFMFGMIATTRMLRRYQKEIMTAEEFTTAGRTVKTGLVSSAVVSSWVWASTLLTSCAKEYGTGIFGGYSYSAGASFQIIAFSILAIKTKQKAPNAHTYLEIIKCRYGKLAHCVYLFYAFATNVLVTAMLLTSGSAVFSDLTGMNSIAAAFLLPLGVVIYTMFGGIRATFLTDYVHTCAIIIIVLFFAFRVYATSDLLGSPGKVYDLVREAAKRSPVSGNYKGEYMTMESKSAGIFLVINLVGNFGTVFLDNGYWNKAISASPAATLPAYVMGGLAWMPIPFLISLTMGFACLATEHDPSFPTYPDPLSSYQVSQGLVLPAAAVSVMGKGGAVATLLMVFLAITSGVAAEVISVASVFTYDVYREYFNPKASGKQLIYSSHIACFTFGVAMSGFSVGLTYGYVSMGYIYEIMGIIISSAVVPVVLTLCWRQQNRIAVICSPVLGTGLAIMSWLVCTKSLFKELTIDTTFEDYPMLAGNVVALCSPCITIPILTYVFKPQRFDWEILKSIKRADESEELAELQEEEDSEQIIGLESVPSNDSSEQLNKDSSDSGNEEKQDLKISESKIKPIKTILSSIQKETPEELNEELEKEKKALARSLKIAYGLCIFFAFAFLLIWPMPMYGSHYIFSKKFFTGWVVVQIIWLFISAFCVILFPLWEGRHGIYTTLRGIYWDLTGQTYKLREWQNSNPEELHIVKSQISARIHNIESQRNRGIDDVIYT